MRISVVRTEYKSDVSPCAQVRFRFGIIDRAQEFSNPIVAAVAVPSSTLRRTYPRKIWLP